jgi:hypothetical protein
MGTTGQDQHRRLAKGGTGSREGALHQGPQRLSPFDDHQDAKAADSVPGVPAWRPLPPCPPRPSDGRPGRAHPEGCSGPLPVPRPSGSQEVRRRAASCLRAAVCGTIVASALEVLRRLCKPLGVPSGPVSLTGIVEEENDES